MPPREAISGSAGSDRVVSQNAVGGRPFVVGAVRHALVSPVEAGHARVRSEFGGRGACLAAGGGSARPAGGRSTVDAALAEENKVNMAICVAVNGE